MKIHHPGSEKGDSGTDLGTRVSHGPVNEDILTLELCVAS